MRPARYVVSVSFDDRDPVNTATNARSFADAIGRAEREWPGARAISGQVILEAVGVERSWLQALYEAWRSEWALRVHAGVVCLTLLLILVKCWVRA